MLKRLLFAVFVLGLVFSLTGTAISGIGQKPADALQPIPTFNPNAQRFNSDIDDARPATAEFKKPMMEIREAQMSGVAPTPPSTYFCEDVGYYDPDVTNVYVWSIPDAYGDDLFNTRFTVDEGVECTLKVGWILMWGSYMAGTPDMRVYLWDDDGFGFPGNKLDSVDVPYANLPTDPAWVGVDMTLNNDWVFADGEEYHIGFTCLGGDGDTLWTASDQATGPHVGEERSSENWGGSWGSMLNDWGVDVTFLMTSERCCYDIPYTDCYSQNWSGGPAYIWRAPHNSYEDDNYAMKFTVEGIETLQSVDIPVYMITDVVGDPDEFGNNAITVTLFADDGAGLPGAVVASKTLAAGSYPAFPSFTNIDFSGDGIIFENEDFFVSFTSDGQGVLGDGSNETTLSDDGSMATGRAYVQDESDGTWYTMAYWWGGEYNFLYYANLCKDPFNDCKWNSNYVSLDYVWNLPDAYGDYAHATKYTSVGLDCQVKDVAWMLYNHGDYGVDASYTYDSKVSVYADAAGLPGTELASIILTPADYNMYPAWTEVDFTSQTVSIPETYWIAIESFAPTPEEGIATLTDFGGSGNNGNSAEFWGGWSTMCTYWGGPCDISFIAKAYHCCVPYPRRDCGPGGEDWATAQHDQARTGASFNAFGDAQCDLTALWGYQHPISSVYDCGPAIVGDKIVCAFQSEVKVFDLATGTPVYTVVPGAASSIIRHVPFVMNGVMYLGGDDQQSITAYDFATGAEIWKRDISGGPSSVFGFTRYTSFNLLNDGVDDILYWGTDNGSIVAAYAATGVLYTGWAVNPVQLGQTVRKSGSTDGTSLFYNSAQSGVDGDVYSIDVLTGDINWQLSTSGGLQATIVFPIDPEDPTDPGQIAEGFPGGNSNENGVVYVNSDIAQPWHPGDGVMYAINAADGTVKWASPSTGARAATGSGTPVIDMNRIYYAGESGWATPVVSRVAAFNKYSGSSAWQFESIEYNNYWGDAALSCEQGAEYDLLFVAGHHGFISALNSSNGEEIYRRRVQMGAYPNAVGLSFAIAPGYLAMTDFYGSLYVLSTTGVDRPRLEIQTYQPAVPVEFGSLPSLEVTIPGVFANTGCSDLTFGQIETNETSSASYIPAFSASNVRDDVMDFASSISDKLTDGFSTKALIHMPEADIDDFFVTRDRSEQLLNAGANAGVGFLQYNTYTEAIISPLNGAILAAGDTADLVLDVNQAMILRGPQDFYAVIPTDDPDFFLHNVPGIATGMVPEIHITIAGGCLSDTVHMPFGMGGANTQIVTNTGRLGLGDWDPHCLDIDGDGGSFYQGGFIYGTGQYELALNCHAWYGQGESFSWHSMQPDPTWCDDVCAIALVEDVPLSCLGGYSEDGIEYTPIMGNFVCATYLDSMQDFSLGGTVDWEWSNFDAGFDNDLTIGLIVNSRTVAAVDFAPLANITVDIMEFTERNGDPVEDWRFGAFVDYDIGNDRAQIDREGSVAFQSSGGVGETQWGMMKFPFGCGSNPNVDFVPMINAVSGHGGGMFYDQYSPPYLDSVYTWMGRPAGLYSQVINTDEEFHCTIARHNFVGGDTYEMAVAQFALHGTDGTSTEAVALAKLANKWLGFGRGDVNNDDAVDLADIIYLANSVNGNGPGPIPFQHLGDVDGLGGLPDMADVLYLIEWYFGAGECPIGDWCF